MSRRIRKELGAYRNHSWNQTEGGSILTSSLLTSTDGENSGKTQTNNQMLQPRNDTHHFLSQLMGLNWSHDLMQLQGTRKSSALRAHQEKRAAYTGYREKPPWEAPSAGSVGQTFKHLLWARPDGTEEYGVGVQTIKFRKFSPNFVVYELYLKKTTTKKVHLIPHQKETQRGAKDNYSRGRGRGSHPTVCRTGTMTKPCGPKLP